MSLLRPAFYFPEQAILQRLEASPAWCVLDLTTSETRAIVKGAGEDKRALVRNWVRSRAEHALSLASPSDDLDSLTLYFGRSPT